MVVFGCSWSSGVRDKDGCWAVWYVVNASAGLCLRVVDMSHDVGGLFCGHPSLGVVDCWCVVIWVFGSAFVCKDDMLLVVDDQYGSQRCGVVGCFRCWADVAVFV